MPSVPPGLIYLIQNLPTLALPPITVLLLGKLASNHAHITEIPAWALITLALLSLPATIAARIAFQHWKDERDAAKHNAVLPPGWAMRALRGGGF